MAAIVEIEYFNSYLIKKMVNSSDYPAFPGILYPGTIEADVSHQYYIEEARIRGGFNNVSTDYGARAYLDEQEPLQQHRFNSLIYSGVYNSRTGINQTNVFAVGTAITRSADPANGSIQLVYAEDTNLLVFQTNKVSKALIDKDTIYTTESGTQTQSGATVIGQIVPYRGEYGISDNPESFAVYGYRKYFADRDRNAIMRLSNDGLTEVSMYGMQDYFRDELAKITPESKIHYVTSTLSSATLGNSSVFNILTSSLTSGLSIGVKMQYSIDNGVNFIDVNGYVIKKEISGLNTIIYFSAIVPAIVNGAIIRFSNNYQSKIIGGWDIHNKNYVVSMQTSPYDVSSDDSSFETVTFDEKINGWVSFLTYKPTIIDSLKNKFYSFNEAELYTHYDNTENNRGLFYNVRKPSNVTFVFNPNSSVMKNFKTISYQGSNGWEVTSFVSGFEGFDSNPANPPVSGQAAYIQNKDSTNVVRSYEEGLYTNNVTGQPQRAGFDRKENRYVANLVSRSAARGGEIIFGNAVTGIKGYFATVTIETDETTQLGGAKELWAAASEFVISSY